jgi:hypothetical protein
MGWIEAHSSFGWASHPSLDGVDRGAFDGIDAPSEFSPHRFKSLQHSERRVQ